MRRILSILGLPYLRARERERETARERERKKRASCSGPVTNARFGADLLVSVGAHIPTAALDSKPKPHPTWLLKVAANGCKGVLQCPVFIKFDKPPSQSH